jgi:hypothetical protein
MTGKPRRREGHLPEGPRPFEEHPPAKQPVSRPKGEPSTRVHVRLPLTLLTHLDRDLDRLEGQTGLKANRGLIARRA